MKMNSVCTVPAEGKNIWRGQHLKSLIVLSVFSTLTILIVGKSGGAMAPLAPQFRRPWPRPSVLMLKILCYGQIQCK